MGLIGCTAVLGIDEDYYPAGQGGATSATNGTTTPSAGGGTGKPRGEPCQEPTECQSQQCTDGVCCEEACDGACAACSQALGATENGICTQHAPLTDPQMECGADQTCDGMGTCVTCGARPEPLAMTCPAECTGGCVANECVFDCAATSCQGQMLVCPAGFKCRVACTQADACRDAIIDCPDTYECRVRCLGGRACDSLDLNCGSGVCELACESGTQVCSGAQMICGAEACVASCGTASTPSVMCNEACVCISCQ